MTKSTSDTPSRYDNHFEIPDNIMKKRKRNTESSSSESNNRSSLPTFIVSLIDNKAREIGLAAMNLRASSVSMCQFTENSATAYSNVCNMLHVYSPCAEVILPKTIENSKLALAIKDEFPNIQISFIPRKFFNETKGNIMLKQLAMKESSAIESEVSKKYLCVSATAALIDYVEYIQSVTFATQSIKFLYKPLTGHLLIDSSSTANLELVMNLKTGKKEETLLSVLDHTKTPMGSRLLRYSILQPLRDSLTINTRLDCVEELLKNEQLFFNISNSLSGFMDMDHLLTQFTYTHRKSSPNSNAIRNIICLKKCIEAIIALRPVLSEYTEQTLLETIHQNLQDEDIISLMHEITKIIDEEATICM
jgi:DNA mismatch repair protein MSH4